MTFKPAFCIYLLVAGCMFFHFHAFAQIDTAGLSSTLERSKDKLGKDAVFLLYNGGKVMYKKELGKLNTKSVLPAGAASQLLTTALVMTFVQEGKLSLDDKVSDYLPLFAKHGKGYITIKHCLTHNTGIEAERGVLKIFQKSKFKNLEEEVNDYASKKEIETNPGTQFKYNNIGFNIAGRVLEIISKKPFDRLMQERLLRPLVMRNTTFTNENYNDAVSPATGVTTTAADYINFLAMLANKGTFNNKIFLDASSLEVMFKTLYQPGEVMNAPKPVEGMLYGTGVWILEENANGKATIVAAPSLFGSWPVANLCSGYAFVLLTKELSNDTAKEVMNRLLSVLEPHNKPCTN